MFVESYLEGKALSSHRKHFYPFFKKCRMCELTYRYIGKLETLKKDLKYLKFSCRSMTALHIIDIRFIYHKTGIDTKLVLNQAIDRKAHVSSGGSTDQLAKKYFATLTKTQLQRLK